MRTVVGLSQPISDNQAQKLDGFAMTFNRTMRQLYVDLIINEKDTNILKSDCIANNNLNARHYNRYCNQIICRLHWHTNKRI